MLCPRFIILCAFACASAVLAAPAPDAFLEHYCFDCHDTETHKGELDLTTLPRDFTAPDVFARWVKIHDRVQSGEMPPKKKARPPAAELDPWLGGLHTALASADQTRAETEGRSELRRLTRVEYENTIRDLLDLPGIALQELLPADGTSHGFDKLGDALDMSQVNLAKYMEAADRALDMAIATSPNAPTVTRDRYSLAANRNVRHGVLLGDCVMLKNRAVDPAVPPPSSFEHLDIAAHELLGSVSEQSSVGLFRQEGDIFFPMFTEFVAVYSGRYRIRASFWSFHWQKGQVLPSRWTEAAKLSAVQLRENSPGAKEGSRLLGYFDAPSLEPQVHEFDTWLNRRETIGFNAASLAPVVVHLKQGRAMGFDGPGIASDWLEIEGPINDIWPPESHRRLFGELLIQEFDVTNKAGIHAPTRLYARRKIGKATNVADLVSGVWTATSEHPLEDADRLLAAFLPRAFRRPVDTPTRQRYVAQVEHRLQAGDCFETAMRWAYRAALCSPNFLYRLEKPGRLDDHALASRLSYFLCNSAPDAALTELAASGRLHDPKELAGEVERALKDPRSDRFIEDFLGQWLRLREIANNDPDKKLYPEFSAYLLDVMRKEPIAFFRELLDQNLDATHLVRSDFAMLNQRLATHYDIPGVAGTQFRRVPLPAGNPRGGFLTQAAVLKITANGTTTSPIVRGAFVMARLLGEPPEPPPPGTPALEPDVRGATTIREQLDKHRTNPACAACHVKIDPPGFALESFDPIGGWRARYRSISDDAGDPPERGHIDPAIHLGFRLGPPVDPHGELPDGRAFADVVEIENLLSAQPERLLKNLAEQFVVYATGHEITFADRDEIARIVQRTAKQGGGVRTLLHEVIASELFQSK